MTALGMSAPQIAVVMGLTERTVVRIRGQVGIAQPPPGPPFTPREMAVAQALLDDGCSYAEVARTLGRADTSVRDHFPGYGWTRTECGRHTALVRRLAS